MLCNMHTLLYHIIYIINYLLSKILFMVYQNKTTKNSFARERKKFIKTDNNSSLYIFFMDLIFSLFYHRKIYHSKTLINRGTRYLNLSIMELIPREEHM